MVNFLLGQPSGDTKYLCFTCLLDSRERDDHWLKKGWPLRDSMRVGEVNVIKKPLVAREKNHHSTTAYKTWFDEAVCKSLACY